MRFRFGGAVQRRIRELAVEQARRGHQVTVFCGNDHDERLESDGVRFEHVRCATPSPFCEVELQLRVVARLRKPAMHEMNVPDVLHFHGQAEGALLSGPLGIPTVLSYDYFRFRTDHFLLPTGRSMLYWPYRSMLRRFDRLLPCSAYCARESCAHWKISTANVRILYNGVNLAQFRPDVRLGDLMRESLGLDRRVVLYVGRVCVQKGSDVLVESVRRLRRARTDFTLAVAGPIGQFGVSSDTSRWPDTIDAVGGRYLGPIEEDRLAAVYNMADVFVMPTREFEMFGMAAVEAQACGKPVVASDHGGLAETVPEEVGGRFPVGDAAALARRLDGLLSDRTLYRHCARAALANARRFDWSAICDDLQRYYVAG